MDRSSNDDLYRSQKTMIVVRWVAVPWAIFQFVAYENPYPHGYPALAVALVALLVIGNATIHLLHRSPRGLLHADSIAIAAIGLDIALISGIVWLFAFDQDSALWALLFILPLEGAITFQLRGAMWAWGVSALIYVARELYGSERFDYPLLLNSITYRMGIGGFISLVAGLMARDLVRQRRLLTEALSELQRVDQLRSGLISTLSHDVRSPLTVIRGAIDTVLKRRSRLTDEDVTQLLSGADRQARRLEALATDLLDLARLEAGRLELRLEELGVEEAARNALSYLEIEQAFETRIEEGLTVTADPKRLEQILYNLVTNAVRHGEPPFVIEAEQRNGQVLIHISDHGPGVAPQEQPHLFEPFRADTASGSVGYGLAIVSALVGAHGGTVTYTSNRPHGARFSVALPAQN
jgi:signal transduction histidine kinase